MFRRCLAMLLWSLATVVQATSPNELRDPTRPTGERSGGDASLETAELETPLRLQGLLSRGGKRDALINGRRVSVGDVVGNAQVTEINNKQVILEQDGETIQLVVGVGPVKSPNPDNEVNR